MKFSVFDQTPNDATKESMFLGQSINLQRYDKAKYQIFNELTEKQKSFFWRPEEIDLSKDRIDFEGLPEHEKHIFLRNLDYQSILDSIQGRSPAIAFLPLTSIPELEHWTIAWDFFEAIHSYSYTYIMRNVLVDPSEEFDSIVVNEEIKKRAESISQYYDDLIEYSQYYNLLGEGEFKISKRIDGSVYDTFKTITISKRELMKKIYLCMFVVNVLEAIRFFVSFSCSFSFAERKLMEGNAKIIKLIARDEALHLTTTQHIINTLASGAEGSEWKEIAEETKEECINIFREAAQQEKDWAKYLFKDGSIIGLNETILCQYIDYITNHRMKAVGLEPIFPNANSNPIPWINTWLTSDNVQVAPQEVEISSYLVGQVDSALDSDDLADIEL